LVDRRSSLGRYCTSTIRCATGQCRAVTPLVTLLPSCLDKPLLMPYTNITLTRLQTW
jgi:hypothetical protein